MSRLLRSILVALCAVPGLVVVASAQLPYASSAAAAAALSRAQDSLGTDVVAVGIATVGPNPMSGASDFDIESGTAGFWVYTHYSPARDRAVTHALFQAEPGGFYGGGGVYDPAGGFSPGHAIDLGLEYAPSDRMAAAIRGNSEYQTFRSRHAAARILLATLTSTQAADIPELPPGFDGDDPIWSLVMSDAADSTTRLTCVVSAATGRTHCVPSAPSGIAAEARADAPAMRLSPNPARGLTHVTITPAPGRSAQGLRMALFDALGREILDLTGSLAGNGYTHAVLDAGSLAAGHYFLRALDERGASVLGVVSIGR